MPSIVIVDDHRILREGLRALFDSEEGFEVVGEANTGREAVDLVKRVEPDIVLMDISMRDLNGIEATRQIVADDPQVKVLALSMHLARKQVSRMLQAGASGYVLKDTASNDLLEAIRIVLDGGVYLSPGVAGVVVGDYVDQISHPARTESSPLSAREREVLQLIAEGQSAKEIATALHLSVKTVESHRKNTMDKLDLHSVAELTKYALREGITTLDD